MRTQYYQVTGRGPLAVDYPGGVAKAHRPGETIGPISPANRSIQRGLRAKRLRKLSDREANALRSHASASVVAPKPLTQQPAPFVDRDDTPIVIVDDQPPASR